MKYKMKYNKLSEKEKRVVEEFKDKLLKRFKDKILLIKLFGSKARGDAKRGSDIDIMVVYKGNGKTKNSLINMEWEILKKYDYEVYISVILYGFKEYKYDYKIQTPFIYNVTNEGVILWDTIPKKMY